MAAILADWDLPLRNLPTDIAVVPARRARSFLIQPRAAMSLDISRPSNVTSLRCVAPIESQDYRYLAPVVNNKNTQGLTMGAGWQVASSGMGGRPVFHPEIGQFFTDLREAKGWTQRQAEDIAERRKLAALTRQVLWRLEKGKVKNLDPKVLRALAELYDMSYEGLVERWTAHRYGVAVALVARDLPGHAGPGSSPAVPSQAPQGGDSDSAPAAPTRVLAVDPGIVRALENVAALVARAITEARGQRVPAEDARTGKGQPRVRRGAGGHR